MSEQQPTPLAPERSMKKIALGVAALAAALLAFSYVDQAKHDAAPALESATEAALAASTAQPSFAVSAAASAAVSAAPALTAEVSAAVSAAVSSSETETSVASEPMPAAPVAVKTVRHAAVQPLPAAPLPVASLPKAPIPASTEDAAFIRTPSQPGFTAEAQQIVTAASPGQEAPFVQMRPAAKPAQLAAAKAPAGAKSLALTDTALLRSKAPQHVTLQLMASGNHAGIQAFLAKQQLQTSAWVYETTRQGKPWFVVLLGDHATRSAANTALRQLPAALKKLKPWPKSFAQVQKELN
ncbi:MAG: SPOR domain-containing protein [Aeromonas sp.]